jgi:hypothetical protein
MPPNKPEKNYWAIKSAVGSLFKAVTLSTDPAQTLSFASSLINTTRAFLIQKLEEKVPDSAAIPYALNTILKTMVVNWDNGTVSPEGIKIMDERIDAIWKDTAMARYGLQIYRDILFCDSLHVRWKDANAIYVQSNSAWAISNSQLADINKQLMEIIVRHDLMTFPKGEVFNMDEIGSSMGRIMKRVGNEPTQEG